MTKRLRRAFTIVELVIAVAVIAILAAVLIPTFTNVISKSQESAGRQDAKNAYTQHVVTSAGELKTDCFLYIDGEDRIFAIESGSVLRGAYSSVEEALRALKDDPATAVDESANYKTVSTQNERLLAVVLKGTYENLASGDIALEESKLFEDESGESTLAFSLDHEGLNIASLSVPASAIADSSKPVTVTVMSVDPSESVTLGENEVAYAYDIHVTNLREGLSSGELVEVTLAAPTALPSMNVYHNGEKIDATYDERTGTVTFRTDSFSPFALSYTEIEVATVQELRDAVSVNNAYIKLTADLEANLDKGVEGNVCDDNHAWWAKSYSAYNPENVLYFLALIRGVDVTIDLNGHSIRCVDQQTTTFVNSDGKTVNQCWFGAVFCVNEKCNLNITDSAGGGAVRVVGDGYAVWSHHLVEGKSTDIYGGIFMADSYVGDELGAKLNYNTRALVYAGQWGNVHVYGGYFLYNNFDYGSRKSLNNGGFNVMNSATAEKFYNEYGSPNSDVTACIRIYDGVKLINQYYRQTTGTDDDTILLADGCEVVEASHSVTIDGVTYDTWYEVRTQKPRFETVLPNTETYLYRVGNSNAVSLGSLVELVSTSIAENATINVTIEKLDANTNVSGTYTAASSVANWESGTIKFTGTGVVRVTINDSCELLLEVVEGYNVTQYSELKSNRNNVLLADITMTSGGTFSVGAKSLFGNGYTFDITAGNNASGTHGILHITDGLIDNVKIVGAVYPEYNGTYKSEYSSAAIAITGSATIQNSYISGCASPLYMDKGTVLIEDTVLYGGTYANFDLRGGEVTLRNVTTVNVEQTASDGATTVLGFGVVVYHEASSAKITVEGEMTQYNRVTRNEKSYLPSSASSYVDTAFSYSQFVYTYNNTEYVNLGIISISSNVLKDSITVPSPYSTQNVQNSACVATYNNTLAPDLLANGVPVYGGWSPTTQGAYQPAYTWNYPEGYNATSGAIGLSFETGSSVTLDPNFLTATKHGISLPVAVSMDENNYTGGVITFTAGGIYTLTYTVTDAYNYQLNEAGDGYTTYSKTYTFTLTVNVTETAPSQKNAEFTYTDGSSTKVTTIGSDNWVMPDVSATSSTIGSTTVNGTTVYFPIIEVPGQTGSIYYAPMFSAINITSYDADNNPTTYNTSGPTTEVDSSIYGINAGSESPWTMGNSAYETIAFKSGLGLCYKTERNKNNDTREDTRLVSFYFVDGKNTTYKFYIQYDFGYKAACVTPDTLITLADGTQKRVDALTGSEQLLVWNLETGALDTAPIMFIDSDPATEYQVIHLYFSDGTDVKVIYEHGFWDYDLNKYVYLDANASQYIGHTFAKQSGSTLAKVKLTSVVLETQVTAAYSPVTVGHLCYFVNGMLSMPGGIGGLLNIFEVDSATMRYDEEKMQRDIQTYGLFTYEELNALAPLSREMFDAAGGQFLKIAIGKGNLTMEELIALINRYSKFFE